MIWINHTVSIDLQSAATAQTVPGRKSSEPAASIETNSLDLNAALETSFTLRLKLWNNKHEPYSNLKFSQRNRRGTAVNTLDFGSNKITNN